MAQHLADYFFQRNGQCNKRGAFLQTFLQILCCFLQPLGQNFWNVTGFIDLRLALYDQRCAKGRFAD
ncbi:hypothetical protein LG301_01570 [Vreelandella venusta]|uniref:hypothetical protein n=1 Tax=Vreelandella venusta TaxID=44935 RepID=UPI00384BC94B